LPGSSGERDTEVSMPPLFKPSPHRHTASGSPGSSGEHDTEVSMPPLFKPHPQPPKPSIANAETLTTPQIPPQLLAPPVTRHVAQPVPQLGMPPGITVSPASAPAPLQSADASLRHDGFGDDREVDPTEVVAPPRAERASTGGRDVLAGWGWSTGSVQAVTDDDDFAEVARAGRKRLVIAIGGALGAVAILAILAFAFGNSKPAGQDTQATSKPSASRPVPAPPVPTPPVPTTAPAGGSVAPASDPGQAVPAAGSAQPSTEPTPSGRIAAETPGAPPPGAATPSTEAPTPPKVAGEPATAAATEPSRPAPSTPAAELPRPEPSRPEPPKVQPPRPAPEPPKAQPAKVTPEPAKPPPAKIAAALTNPEPTKKSEVKRPAPEPRKPSDKPAKRPTPPERITKVPARAQPIDPYAAPSGPSDRPRADPTEAYKTGLQQYARGDTTAALSTFRTSLAINPGFAPTWRGLGLVYEKLGNKVQARSAFKRYLQLAPTAADADQVRDRLERLGS
jgi:hypothetical protein